MKYIRRIIDTEIDKRAQAFNAINIVGPKGCGKTRTANKEHPGVVYRKPSLLIVICANAPMAYTTENGVKVIPAGCLRD